MARVLCESSLPIDRIREILAGLDVSVDGASPPWEGGDAVGLIAWEPVRADDFERLPALRVVAVPGVGFDHVDVETATRRGIWVCNVPDYCVEEMADHALALLLGLVRGVVALDRNVQAGHWDHDAAGPLGRIGEIRLGVVGFGRIGRALVSRSRALGLEVRVHDPLVPADVIAAAGALPATLDELLCSSSAVSLHAPLTEKTRGLLGPWELALLPPGAYVVNVSRGELVHVDALLEALANGRLGGAALDVLAVEPPTPEHPAPQHPRLVVTPHAGWYSERAEERVYRGAAESVLDVLEGRAPRGAVNTI